MTKTERLIDRIKKVEKFYDVAFLCEDFQTFVDEIQEWGVDHICGVDFDDPDLNLIMLNAFFGSFGCTNQTHTQQGGMRNEKPTH